MAEASARRLYESGFEGWDIQQATYLTDYLVMTISIALALLAYDAMRGSEFGLWGLLTQFGLFALFEGVAYGFGGITHHMLDTYFERGEPMDRSWGHPNSEWMFAWLMAVVCAPLASSCCAGCAFAFGELGIGWIKVVKVCGAIVSVFEGYLVFSDQVDSSGTVAVYWAVITSLLSCCACFSRGSRQAGVWQVFIGNVVRLAGFFIIIFAPASCRSAGGSRVGCPYPEKFNHNAIYHCCIAASVVLIYVGVMDKFKLDRENAYNLVMRRKPDSRMCGC
mmetsp:Transcript_90470/g.230080  ORF Transcript_90470/g.230080 Transcript_90470/m.230080 type:complete len:278 (+) Transcript_90470:70-903(+)